MSSGGSSTATARLLDRMATFVKAESLLERGDHVLVAVSGGADSMCLLDALTELGPAWDLTMSVAHFDHQLREGSAREGEMVAAWCRDRGLACHVAVWNRAPAARTRGCLEAAAHDARYHFLKATAESNKATRIAFGHTADDQVETMLMHLVRGSGLRGLVGLAPKRGNCIRPLLTSSAEETRSWCVQRGIAWIEDLSNVEPIARRNTLRRDIVPLLRHYNPNLREAFSRTAEALRVDFAYLTSEAIAALAVCVRAEPPDVPQLPGTPKTPKAPVSTQTETGTFRAESSRAPIEIDRSAYAMYDPAIRRRMVQLLFERCLPAGRQGDAEHLVAADRLLLEGATGQALSLPGDVELRVEYQRGYLTVASGPALPLVTEHLMKEESSASYADQFETVVVAGHEHRDPSLGGSDERRARVSSDGPGMSTLASGKRSTLPRGRSHVAGSLVGDGTWLEQPVVEGCADNLRGGASSRLWTAVGHDSVADSRSGATVGSWEPFRLAIPGAVSPEGAGWTIEATLATPPSHPPDDEPNVAWLDAELLGPPLLVRPRAPGDRFTPSGMRGRQKVHDLLVNKKILREERDRLPVVLTGDTVVWVGGVRVAEVARWRFDEPPASGRTAVRLELRRPAKTTA